MSNISKVHVRGKDYTISAGAWVPVTMVRNSTYISELGLNNQCWYNESLKLVTAFFNFKISTVPVNSNNVLISGLPKAIDRIACVSADAQGNSLRLYINANGELLTAMQATSNGWYNGSITYPYSSL